MSRDQLNRAIADFHSNFPRPGIGALLFHWCDLDTYKSSGWPHGGNPGVYVFLDSEENLLYIGKASSDRTLNTRLRGYFDADKGVKDTRSGNKAKGTRYVGLLALPPDHGFEAPAIEEWLIGQLDPVGNTVITRKRRTKVRRVAVKAAQRQLIANYPEEYDRLVKQAMSSQ
jgi:hypothetical protein